MKANAGSSSSSSFLASSPAPAVCRCDPRAEELEEPLQEPRGAQRQALVLHQQPQHPLAVLPSSSVWGDQPSPRSALRPLLCWWRHAPPRSDPSLLVSGPDRGSGSPPDAAPPPARHRLPPGLLHVRHHHRPLRPRRSRPFHRRHPRLPQTEEAVEEPEEVGPTCPPYLWPRPSADSALVPAE